MNIISPMLPIIMPAIMQEIKCGRVGDQEKMGTKSLTKCERVGIFENSCQLLAITSSLRTNCS